MASFSALHQILCLLMEEGDRWSHPKRVPMESRPRLVKGGAVPPPAGSVGAACWDQLKHSHQAFSPVELGGCVSDCLTSGVDGQASGVKRSSITEGTMYLATELFFHISGVQALTLRMLM